MILTEDVVRSTLLFTHLCMFGEKQSEKLSRQILDRLKEVDEQEFAPSFVRLTYKIWQKKISKATASIVSSKVLRAPKNLNLSKWAEFRLVSGEDEFLAVLWAKIIGIEEAAIAEALGVSSGTMTYRLSRGIKKLSDISDGVAHA